MAKRQADLDRGVERMMGLNGTTNDVTFTVTRGVTRPVWEPNAGTMALYEQARAVGAKIGLDLIHGSSGGGSDGISRSDGPADPRQPWRSGGGLPHAERAYRGR